MHLFDLARFKVDARLAKRLGFQRIFTNEEISIGPNPRPSASIIVARSQDDIYRNLNNGSVMGYILETKELPRQAYQKIKEHEKMVFIPISEMVKQPPKQRLERLKEARKRLREISAYRVRTCAVSLASGNDELLSAVQMQLICLLIGAPDAKAKQMLHELDGFNDKKKE